MKKVCTTFILLCILCVNWTFAQKLTLTQNGVRASDNPSCQHVEYTYRNGVEKKDLRDYCIQKLSQPDFYSYRVDYTDEQTIKINGYTKKNFKGLNFNMLVEFGPHSVKISADLFDKDGAAINEKSFHSLSERIMAETSGRKRLTAKKEKKLSKFIAQIKAKENKKAEKFVTKNRDEVESKFDEVIRSMMEMKIVIH